MTDPDIETRPVERAADLVARGIVGGFTPAEAAEIEAAFEDPDPRVRAAALAALARGASRRRAGRAWRRALLDPAPAVRRRAAELAPLLGRAVPVRPLAALLDDTDVTVVDAAAWALGELGPRAVHAGATGALVAVARGHGDPVGRAVAVAALGALGAPGGLGAILAACDDKPPVRRRAVLALAPFGGPAVDAALTRALDDRDWQVRQAAEDLLD
jgi:HEAT repeat protein